MADAETPRPRKRAVEWLLEGESVRTNRHLARFAAAPYLPRLLADPASSALLSRSSRSLRKEIIEAYGMLEQVEATLRGAAPAAIVDLCCGSGFLSLALANEFPAAAVLMFDLDTRIRVRHDASHPNLRFEVADIMADGFGARLGALLREAGGQRGGGPCVAVGMHLCGALSPRAISLFAAESALDSLLLAPCCLDKRFDAALKATARQLGRDAFECKVDQLREALEALPRVEVRVARDASFRTNRSAAEGGDGCKNAMIVGQRRAASGPDAPLCCLVCESE